LGLYLLTLNDGTKPFTVLAVIMAPRNVEIEDCINKKYTVNFIQSIIKIMYNPNKIKQYHSDENLEIIS